MNTELLLAATYAVGFFVAVIVCCASLGRNDGTEQIGRIVALALTWPLVLVVVAPAEIGFWINERRTAQAGETRSDETRSAA